MRNEALIKVGFEYNQVLALGLVTSAGKVCKKWL